MKLSHIMWWDNDSAGADERCCQCPSIAYVLHNKKWYCRECFWARNALGEWADLVELIEEASNEVQEMR